MNLKLRIIKLTFLLLFSLSCLPTASYENPTGGLSGLIMNYVASIVPSSSNSDVLKVVFTGMPSAITEDQSVTVQIKLSKAITSNLTVSVTLDNSAITIDGSSSKTFTFAPENATTNQTFTLLAVGDTNTISETVKLVATATGLDDQTVSITALDTTTAAPAISISNVPSSLSEGTSTSIGVKLTGNVNQNYSISVSNSNSLSISSNVSTLSFTSSNYSIDQQIVLTALQDQNLVSESVTITLTATGLTPVSFTITATDDDTQNISISGTTTLNEGGSGSLSVSLTKEPSSDVIVNLSSNNTSSLTLASSSLTFTSTNYSTPQSVVINSLQDANQTSETVTITASSSGITSATWNVLCIDDVITVVFGTPNGYEGSTVTVPITLSGNPGDTRTISFSSNNNPPTFSPNTMSFTTSNFNTAQTLTLTGLTDSNTTTVITAVDSNQASSTKLVTSTWNATTAKYNIGGTVSGLTGSLVLTNQNTYDTVTVSGNGNFTFPKTASIYTIGAKLYTLGKICLISNSSGIASSAVTNITVTCTNKSYTLGEGALGLISTGQTTSYQTGDDGTHQGTLKMSFTDNGDGTITDNVSGLVFQKCLAGLNSLDCSGTATESIWTDAVSYCSSLSHAGKTWRLPTIKELVSISDITKSALIDTGLFPSISNVNYWSITEISSTNTMGSSSSNYISNQSKILTNKIRCVSGISPQTQSFMDNGNGTVSDNLSGLVWQKCSAGLGTTLGDCSTGTFLQHTWSSAINYCENLDLGGQTDWRLPNIKELISLVDFSSSSLTSINDIFTNTKINFYLSSTTATIVDSTRVWRVDFSYGRTDISSKTGKSYVRCVRGP